MLLPSWQFFISMFNIKLLYHFKRDVNVVSTVVALLPPNGIKAQQGTFIHLFQSTKTERCLSRGVAARPVVTESRPGPADLRGLDGCNVAAAQTRIFGPEPFRAL